MGGGKLVERLHAARSDLGRPGRWLSREEQRDGVRLLIAHEPTLEQQLHETRRLRTLD